MGTQLDKLKERIRQIPADFSYSELTALLSRLGFEEKQKGSTSGSRVLFYRPSDEAKIMLHKPHPGSIVRRSALREVVRFLQGKGDL